MNLFNAKHIIKVATRIEKPDLHSLLVTIDGWGTLTYSRHVNGWDVSLRVVAAVDGFTPVALWNAEPTDPAKKFWDVIADRAFHDAEKRRGQALAKCVELLPAK